VRAALPEEGAVLLRGSDLAVRAGGRLLFEGLSLDLRRGEIVVLTGPNGAGKSTLMRVLLGLQRPQGGRVHRADGLRVGFVPQLEPSDPGLSFPAATVVTQGIPWPSRPGRRASALAALERVGFRPPPSRRYDRLSGGERRRVLLARSLVRAPMLLALDEPTAGVDVAGEREVLDLVRREAREEGTAVLWVCHGLHEVEREADHVIRLGEEA
jgi:zinc transport system ATP-binding protein